MPTPLYYTFGNHMHWVDMEWLWGYFVLPASVRDMLAFCNATGAKGNLNFDGIGYEKLAVEAPAALATLRAAVQQGQVEIVGASYGQPYGLFHHGESNIRQRGYGVRSVLRLLGVRPRTFWEEEFDFFPQLPQILAGTGFQYASLFFQWTWHTPHVPHEELPAIWWEGQDGTRLLTAPRNALNLHQWPEDFAGLLEQPLLHRMPSPAIVQWLELMPSPDWMCRSELLLPQLHALMADPRFEIRPVTLSQYLEIARPHAEVRRYTLDDLFHGMSLGKNGDRLRRLSRRGEQTILAAESLSALAGLLGRPYPGWNVYPTWELEEAWRELLQAQHHDNDECEGLCGFVGLRSYERALGLAEQVCARTLALLANRAAQQSGDLLVYNPLGWARTAVVDDPSGGPSFLVEQLPAYGYSIVPAAARTNLAPVFLEEMRTGFMLTRGQFRIAIDRQNGLITQIHSPDFPDGMLAQPLGQLTMQRNGTSEQFVEATVSITAVHGQPALRIERRTADNALIVLTVSIAPTLDAIDLHYQATGLPRPDGGMQTALRTSIVPAVPGAQLIHDHPYALSPIQATGSYPRKYPTGDWMTSPQWFEQVEQPFTALQLLDWDAGERGVLYLHDGGQAFLRRGTGVEHILSMYDPWDEDQFVTDLDAHTRLIPHGPLDNATRWRLAQEHTRPAMVAIARQAQGNLPTELGPLSCDVPGVAITAWFRETAEAGQDLSAYAGAAIEYPTILRLVEFNGQPTSVTLRLPGPVAAAYRTNLLGEIIEQLSASVQPADPQWSELRIPMQPYAIATLYLDLTMARKVTRDLDAHRSVWATIHRIDEK